MKKKHPILRNRMKDKKRDIDFIDLDEQDFDNEDLYDDEDYDDEEYEDDEYDDEEYEDEEYDDEEYDEDDRYDDEEYDDDDRYDEEEYDEEDPEDGYDDDGAYSDAEEGYDDYESSEYDEYDDPEDEYYDDYEEEGFDGYYEDPVGPKKSALDIVMIGSGIVAALLLIVVGVFLIKKNPGTTQSEMFENFGSSMEGIDIIGHEGLIAMADANAARIYAAREAEEMALAEIFEEENGEEEQVKEEKPAIIMNLVSVQKDLKIKFVNNSNNRLVTGVNFEVSVTDPSGTTNTQKDTDADGIIYLKNIDPGTYKVALNGPESDDYIFSKDSVSIKVKDTIEYKKVDVVDEIKSEKEVNAAVEDTAQAIETESTLKDTVEWVESAKVTLSENVTYTEVKKSDESIEKPEDAYKKMTKKSKRFEPDDPTDPEEDEPSPSPSEDPEPAPTTEPDPTDAPTSRPTDDPTPDPTDSPTSRPTDSPTPDPTREPSPSPTKEPTAAPTPTATPKATATATPKATATATAKASVTPSPSVTPTVTPTASPKTTPTATPTISPEEKAKKDTTNILKDKKGNEIYVKDGDKYRKATFADYYKYDVFYKAVKTGEYKYTGWQTIDGYTYFYDKNGK
nr:hypothetical protein [Lachnospiraceae bacterium]